VKGIRAWTAAHRKLLAVITGAMLTVAVQIWGTSNPYVSLGILAATSLGVYRVPNAGAAWAAKNPAAPGPALPSPAPVTPVPGTAGVPPSAAPSPVTGTSGPPPGAG
jgi:hypothetical protein